jgi:hypothetical protein
MAVRIIAIDWSGARVQREARKKIYRAKFVDGHVHALSNGLDREETADFLVDLARRQPDLVVALDFAFSLPAWFLEEKGCATAPDLWALADREAEGWLKDCHAPFWGRPGHKKKDAIRGEEYRRTDREPYCPTVTGIGAKSEFQIGGSGSVGTGSLRGLPVLHRLRREGFAIWPFDRPALPLVVEIYPRVLTGPVNKSRQDQRRAYLDSELPQLPSRIAEKASASDDAFDALVSAIVMARHQGDLLRLPTVAHPEILKEGIIWYPGWRERWPELEEGA